MSRRYELHILLDLPVGTPQLVTDYYNGLPQAVLNKEDSGIDIMVPIDTWVKSASLDIGYDYSGHKIIKTDGDNVTKFDSGIKCCMFDTTTNKPVGYYVYGRSSIYKYNLSVANSVGIIDAGYRGHLIGMVYNMKFDNCLKIDAGTRLFQICAPDLSPLSVRIVDNLPDSARGEGGFGSTGK